jgi:hypothetical protein
VLYVRSNKCSQWGLVEGKVTLVDDHINPSDTINLTTVLTVNEDFSKLSEDEFAKSAHASLSSEALDFGTIDTTSSELITRTFTIKNTGKNKLAIRRIYTDTEGVEIYYNPKDIKSGNTSDVTVTVAPNQLQGEMLNSRISVITNDADNPTQSIRIVGDFKKNS